MHYRIASLSVFRINWKLFYFFAILFSLVILVMYIYSVNQLTQGTLAIKNYGKEINILSDENRSLEIDFAKIGFLDNTIKQAKELGFEKTKSIKYVKIPDNSLARANQLR